MLINTKTISQFIFKTAVVDGYPHSTQRNERTTERNRPKCLDADAAAVSPAVGLVRQAVPCNGKKHTETPTPAPPPVTPTAPVTKNETVEVKPETS